MKNKKSEYPIPVYWDNLDDLHRVLNLDLVNLDKQELITERSFLYNTLAYLKNNNINEVVHIPVGEIPNRYDITVSFDVWANRRINQINDLIRNA